MQPKQCRFCPIVHLQLPDRIAWYALMYTHCVGHALALLSLSACKDLTQKLGWALLLNPGFGCTLGKQTTKTKQSSHTCICIGFLVWLELLGMITTWALLLSMPCCVIDFTRRTCINLVGGSAHDNNKLHGLLILLLGCRLWTS